MESGEERRGARRGEGREPFTEGSRSNQLSIYYDGWVVKIGACGDEIAGGSRVLEADYARKRGFNVGR